MKIEKNIPIPDRRRCGPRPYIRNDVERENNVNKFRVEEGITIRELAEHIGTGAGNITTNIIPGYVSPLKNGRPKKWALKMCEVLGASLSQIWPREVCEMKRGELIDDQKLDLLMSRHSLKTDQFDAIAKKETTRLLNVAIATLVPREIKVIVARFYKEESLEVVGLRFGITRERVRQIEKKALRKLRHPTRLRVLKAERGYHAES